MINFIEKVGNIKVYTEKNTERDFTVEFYNGSDLVAAETYFNGTEENAIADLFSKKLDTCTEEWLWLNLLTDGLEKISNDLYKLGKDYFKRIDNTRYFKHFDHKPMMADQL